MPDKKPPRFTPKDLEIFTIEDFHTQITALWSQISPKLAAWGEILAPRLTPIVGHEVFVHVARHARRTTTPPPETWAAFSANRRGYKKDPCLLLTVGRDGVQARVAIKHEGFDHRKRLSDLLPDRARRLGVGFGCTFLLRDFSVRDFAGQIPPVLDASARVTWQQLCERAARKSRCFDVGHAFTTGQSLKLTEAELLAAYRALAPIYSAVRGVKNP